ncbi:MAG: biotin transporter BioY [Beijerinckiaceae bacterium]
MAAYASPTLIATLWPARTNSTALSAARTVALMVAGTLALWASARISVPFYPVPMTMQTLVVLMIGAAYGARLGLATVALYLFEGLIGLPVFAGTPERGIGLAYMVGPTGGFLLGFAAAAYLTGWLAERGWDRSILKLMGAMALGHAVIFLFGLSWLATFVGPAMAWTFGMAPFYAATLFKTVLGAVALPVVWSLIARKSA